MQARIFQNFGSYDIFGKSIPGAVLLSGILLLLPFESIPTGGNISVIDIAALLLILILIGLMIGEGIHTLALNMEKVFLWIAQRLHHLLNYIRTKFGWSLVDISFKVSYDHTDPPRHIVRVLYTSWNGIVEWLRRRYWGTYDSLAGHRLLLAKSIKWNHNLRDINFDRVKEEKGRIRNELREEFPNIDLN